MKKISNKTTTSYAICITRNYYGPQSSKNRLIDDDTGSEWIGSRAEAHAKIKELDNAVYYTSSNESGRADYTIVKA
jgi:hypothetical protein